MRVGQVRAIPSETGEGAKKYGEVSCIFTNFQHSRSSKKRTRAGYTEADPGVKCRKGPSAHRGLSQPRRTRYHSADESSTYDKFPSCRRRVTTTVAADTVPLASATGREANTSSSCSQPPNNLAESEDEMYVAQVVHAAQRNCLM